MALLNKNQILTADDLSYRQFDVAEWGGAVRVRTMTGAERDAYEAEIYGGGKLNIENVRARFLAKVLVNEQGELLFSDPGDVVVLGKKNARALQRIFRVAQEINALDDATLEELAKNSATGPGAGSPSA